MSEPATVTLTPPGKRIVVIHPDGLAQILGVWTDERVASEHVVQDEDGSTHKVVLQGIGERYIRYRMVPTDAVA
jgi:hypothetical protein